MKQIHLRICDIALTIGTVLSGLCLGAACLTVYRSGGSQIYTPEKVAQAFSTIAVPVYLWLALVVIRGVLHILYPTDTRKIAAPPDEMTLRRLQRRVDLNLCPDELRRGILAAREDRKKAAKNGLIVLLVCSAVFLFYGIDPSHYHANGINTSVITAACFLLICISIPFFWSLDATRRAKHSIRLELELLKTAPASAKVTPPAPQKNRGIAPVRWALLCIALALIVYGFFAGGTADVLTKAVNICTECVGLG